LITYLDDIGVGLHTHLDTCAISLACSKSRLSTTKKSLNGHQTVFFVRSELASGRETISWYTCMHKLFNVTLYPCINPLIHRTPPQLPTHHHTHPYSQASTNLPILVTPDL